MARILIVENSPFFADILACTLGLEGYEVAVATTAGEGVRLGLAVRAEIVIAAWSLRGEMHGGEVVRRIRAAWPGTAAIIITGRHEFVPQAEEFCGAAAAILTKPFHREEILRSVRRVLFGKAVFAPPHSSIPDFQSVAFDTMP
jgi:two-component system, OmpR family, response regulator